MALGIFTATNQGGMNTFAVCPNWANGACGCPKDADGNPEVTAPLTVAHPTYPFVATPPSGWSMATAPIEWTNLGKTQAQWAALDANHQWAFTCLVEAIRLVHHDLAQGGGGTAMPAFVGATA